MRSLVSKANHAKKQQRNSLILGIGLVVLMLLSIVGYSLVSRSAESSSNEGIVFRGFEFNKVNNLWVTKINDLQFVFRNDPREVISIEEQINYANAYSGQPLYISSEHEESTAEIYTNLNQIAERTQKACFENETCEEDLPSKDCTSNFIVIKEANETSIVQNASCVFIQGERDNLLNITDGFLLRTLGITG